MNVKSLVRMATSPLAWLVLVLALVLGACAWRFHRDRREVDVTGWDIARLVDHLHCRGLSVRVVSTVGTAESRQNVFLTTTDADFDRVNSLPRDRKQIEMWRGIVYCAIVKNHARSSDEELGMEGCFLRRGHFVMVGDPELLARISSALTVDH
jgi:hypothetical protein